MKAFSLAALLLCLLSVCGAAPLTCDQLLANQTHDQDLSGRWYMHAVSLDSCFLSTVFRFLEPSIALDHTLKENPRRYESLITIKWMSLCGNETETLYVNNGTIIEGSENKTAVILPSSCSDCVVLKSPSGLMLLSRNTTVGDADLTQFKAQATCAGFTEPLRFKSDYDFKNCKDSDNADLTEEEREKVLEKFLAFIGEVFMCGEEGFNAISKKLEKLVADSDKSS